MRNVVYRLGVYRYPAELTDLS
jgi:hypothetical protein